MRAFYRNKGTLNLLQLWFWDSIGTENIPRIASPSATFCCLGTAFSRLFNCMLVKPSQWNSTRTRLIQCDRFCDRPKWFSYIGWEVKKAELFQKRAFTNLPLMLNSGGTLLVEQSRNTTTTYHIIILFPLHRYSFNFYYTIRSQQWPL